MLYKKTLQLSLLVLILCVSHLELSAQRTSGMDFLNIGPSARSLGLSEAVTSLPLGASSIYFNPSALSFTQKSSLEIDYTNWIVDSQNRHASALLKNGVHTFGASLFSSSVEDIQARGNQAGPSQGTFSVEYISIAGAYAYRYKNFSAGIALHYLNEVFLTNSASGYGFNAGLFGTFLDERLRVGLSLLNAGRMEKLDQVRTKLPTNLRVGASAKAVTFNTPGENDFPITLSLFTDYVQPINDSGDIQASAITQDPDAPYLNLGFEAEGADFLTVRMGYKTGNTTRPLTFGTGIVIDPVEVNYALVIFDTGYNPTHSLGLRYFFDW